MSVEENSSFDPQPGDSLIFRYGTDPALEAEKQASCESQGGALRWTDMWAGEPELVCEGVLV